MSCVRFAVLPFLIGSTAFLLFPAVIGAAEPGVAAKKFALLKGQFDERNGQLKKLGEKIQGTPPAERPKLIKEFEAQAEQLDKILPDLLAAGQAAYVEAPNQDPKVTEMVLSNLAFLLSHDEYEEAVKVAKLLQDNKCDHKALAELAAVASFGCQEFDTAAKLFASAKAAGVLSDAGEAQAAVTEDYKKLWAREKELRAKEAKADDLPRVKLETTKGTIVIELFENEAPQTVGNFVSLVEAKFYDGLSFHRVLPGFMAQGGCPKGDGTGGPGYKIYCECAQPEHRDHFRGTLSMAHAGKNTGGSQFFLTFLPTPHLNNKHTVFGRVIEGLDVLAKLQRIDPSEGDDQTKPDRILKATVLRKRDHAYVPTKVAAK